MSSALWHGLVAGASWTRRSTCCCIIDPCPQRTWHLTLPLCRGETHSLIAKRRTDSFQALDFSVLVPFCVRAISVKTGAAAASARVWYCKQPPSSKPSRHFHFPTTAIDHPSVLFTGGLVSFRRHSLSLSSTRSRRHPRPPVVEHKFYSCPNNFYHPGLSQDRGLAIRVESRYQSVTACTLRIFSIVSIS